MHLRKKENRSGKAGKEKLVLSYDFFNGTQIIGRDVSPFEANEIHKVGVRSFPAAELSFENCAVLKENVLWPAGQGFDKTRQTDW